MANTYTTLSALFTAIADKIRSKTGGTASIVADNFPAEIEKIVTLSSGTSDATAAAGEILTGKTAYVKGSKVTGSMANNGAVSQAINAGGSYTIPAGYHNGFGKVTGNTLASQTSANAVAGDIRSGKTAWVNGAKVTGNLVPATVVTGVATVNSSGKLVISALKGKSNFMICIEYAYDHVYEDIISMAYINGKFTDCRQFTSNGLQNQTYGGKFDSATGTISHSYFNIGYDETFRYVGW